LPSSLSDMNASTSAAKATDITWHDGHVDRSHRETLLGQKGALLWLTGLSGSGKSTIAFHVEHALISRGVLAYVLDGDNIRHGLNSNLGFTADDRAENIRRIGEVGKLFVDTGVITVSSFVSPYRSDRDSVRSLLNTGDFFEVFINTPMTICEQRDPKGLYKKARTGEIPNFTGISAPYEEPTSPDLEILTENLSVYQAAGQIISLLERHNKISAVN
jgi:adenylylsulfate kinase